MECVTLHRRFVLIGLGEVSKRVVAHGLEKAGRWGVALELQEVSKRVVSMERKRRTGGLYRWNGRGEQVECINWIGGTRQNESCNL